MFEIITLGKTLVILIFINPVFFAGFVFFKKKKAATVCVVAA